MFHNQSKPSVCVGSSKVGSSIKNSVVHITVCKEYAFIGLWKIKYSVRPMRYNTNGIHSNASK